MVKHGGKSPQVAQYEQLSSYNDSTVSLNHVTCINERSIHFVKPNWPINHQQYILEPDTSSERLLTEPIINCLPYRPSGAVSHLLSLGSREIYLPATSNQIDLTGPHKPRPMPKLPPNKADKNNRRRKHIDKTFIGSGTSTDWSDGNIKFCNDAENIHKESKIAPPDIEDSFEGKIVNVLLLRFRRSPETHVREVDRSPSEEKLKAGKGEEPVKDTCRFFGVTPMYARSPGDRAIATSPVGAPVSRCT